MTMIKLDSQHVERLLHDRMARKQTRKRAILAHNLDAILRLRAAGCSYREIAQVFSKQGVTISASTVHRFLRDHERSKQGTVTPAENLPDWDSNGGSKRFGESDTMPKTVPEASNPPVPSDHWNHTQEGDALELEAEKAFRNKIRNLKQEIEDRQTSEIPETNALRRHIEI